MSSLVEIRNIEEIYIHYFADKVRVTDAKGVEQGECKPMVFSLTQIESENFCQDFVSEKCDRLKGMQDFCQNEKTRDHSNSSGSISRNEVDLMGKPIYNSRIPSHGLFKDADGSGGGKRCEQTHVTDVLDIESMKGNKLKKTEGEKEKVKKKERVTEEKVREKGKFGSEELGLNSESFFDPVPKRRKDATTQVEKRSMRRLLGKKPNSHLT